MKTIRALGLVALLAFGSAVGAFAQQKRPADVAKEADVAKGPKNNNRYTLVVLWLIE